MTDQFVAEIRILPFTFAPSGWAQCDGQLLPISQNTALFSLLGTVYGGDGKSTFGLPNLQGNSVMQPGQGQGLSPRSLGETGGEQYVTLLQTEMPVHTHNFVCSARPATARQPANVYLAAGQGVGMYDTNAQPTTTGALNMITPTGGGLPHNNLMPFLTTIFCIALQGIYPPRP
jgi:microcystin-dependent protein